MNAFAIDRRGTQIPTGDALLMVAVVIAGVVAASLAEPVLWYLTPVVGICLMIASRQGVHRQDAREFPTELQSRLDETLEALPSGLIRALYGDVIIAARPIFARRMRRMTDASLHDTRHDVAELLTAASQVALDAARLDASLRSGSMLQRSPTVEAAAEKTRAQYTRQLEDVVATLNALVASGLMHGTPESERVSELLTEIRDETTARTEAWKEIDSLLS